MWWIRQLIYGWLFGLLALVCIDSVHANDPPGKLKSVPASFMAYPVQKFVNFWGHVVYEGDPSTESDNILYALVGSNPATVTKFSGGGGPLETNGGFSSVEPNFITGIAKGGWGSYKPGLDANGNLYFQKEGFASVTRYNASGSELGSYAPPGSLDGQPLYFIGVDDAGRIVVLNNDTQIMRFNNLENASDYTAPRSIAGYSEYTGWAPYASYSFGDYTTTPRFYLQGGAELAKDGRFYFVYGGTSGAYTPGIYRYQFPTECDGLGTNVCSSNGGEVNRVSTALAGNSIRGITIADSGAMYINHRDTDNKYKLARVDNYTAAGDDQGVVTVVPVYHGANPGVLFMSDNYASSHMSSDANDNLYVTVGTNLYKFVPNTFDVSTDLSPTAGNMGVQVDEDSSVSIEFAFGDPQGDPMTWVMVSAPSQGQLRYNSNLLGLAETVPFNNAATTGSVAIEYHPNANFNGDDSFTYRVRDSNGAESAIYTVDIAVSAVNDAPEFQSEPETVVSIGSAYDYAPNGVDVDGDAISITAEVLPAWADLVPPAGFGETVDELVDDDRSFQEIVADSDNGFLYLSENGGNIVRFSISNGTYETICNIGNTALSLAMRNNGDLFAISTSSPYNLYKISNIATAPVGATPEVLVATGLFSEGMAFDKSDSGQRYVYFGNDQKVSRYDLVGSEGMVDVSASFGRRVENIDFDSNGNLYVGLSNKIKKVSPPFLTTSSGLDYSTTESSSAMSIDNQGNLYGSRDWQAGGASHHIYRIDSGTQAVTNVLGNATSAGSEFDSNNPINGTRLNAPEAVDVGHDGHVYVIDYSNSRLLRLNGASVNSKLTGTPSAGDEGYHEVRLVASDGQVTTSQTWSIMVGEPDTDGDGTTDPYDQFPEDPEKQFEAPDFSATELGQNSAISGLGEHVQLWLDASNINGSNNERLANGAGIKQWRDLSGNGHHLDGYNTPALSKSGFNGRDSMVFDQGDEDYFFLADTGNSILGGKSEFTIFTVVHSNRESGAGQSPVVFALWTDGIVINNNDQSSGVSLSLSDSTVNFLNTQPWGSTMMSTNQHINQDVVVEVSKVTGVPPTDMLVNNQAYSYMYHEPIHQVHSDAGVDIVIGSNTNTSELKNSGSFFNGEMAEILIFDKELTVEQKIEVRHYLSKKWGLESTLDSDGDGVLDSADPNPLDSKSFLEQIRVTTGGSVDTVIDAYDKRYTFGNGLSAQSFSLATFQSMRQLEVKENSDFEIQAGIKAEHLFLRAGSRLKANGGVLGLGRVEGGGSIEIDNTGTVVTADVIEGNVMARNGGRVKANVIRGLFDLENAVHSPGFSPGQTEIDTFNVGANSVIEMEIDGPNAGTQYDQYLIGGDMTIDSTATLNIRVTPSYTASVINNQEFVLAIATGNIVGQFEKISWTGAPAGFSFVASKRIVNSKTELVVTARNLFPGDGTSIRPNPSGPRLKPLFLFTNAGAGEQITDYKMTDTTYNGPTAASINADLASRGYDLDFLGPFDPDDGKYQGYQYLLVPTSSFYRIEAWGAQGGRNHRDAENYSGYPDEQYVDNTVDPSNTDTNRDVHGRGGGGGAKLWGDFELSSGDKLVLLVGQRGQDNSPTHNGDGGGGGGGGTFVVRLNNPDTTLLNSTNITPLVVAGGGAGAPDQGSDSRPDFFSARIANAGVDITGQSPPGYTWRYPDDQHVINNVTVDVVSGRGLGIECPPSNVGGHQFSADNDCDNGDVKGLSAGIFESSVEYKVVDAVFSPAKDTLALSFINGGEGGGTQEGWMKEGGFGGGAKGHDGAGSGGGYSGGVYVEFGQASGGASYVNTGVATGYQVLSQYGDDFSFNIRQRGNVSDITYTHENDGQGLVMITDTSGLYPQVTSNVETTITTPEWEGNSLSYRWTLVTTDNGAGIRSIGAPSFGTTVSGTDVTSVEFLAQLPLGVDQKEYTLELAVSDGVGVTTETMEITVNRLNNRPTAQSFELAVTEDVQFVFSESVFTDPNQGNYQDLDALSGIKLLQVPTMGVLLLNGQIPALNTLIVTTDLQTLTYQANPNDNGDAYATLNYTVYDGIGDSVQAYTITINVTAVNDFPTVTIPSQVATEDVMHNVVFTVDDVEGSVSAFEYGVSVSNESLFDLGASGFVTANGSDTVTLNLVPIPNANGTALVTVTVTDNEHVVVQIFTITVNAVNDAPTFGISTTDIQVNEGGDRVTENNFIVGVDAVDAADAIHTVTLSMQVGDHQLFTIRPTLNWVSRRDLSLIYQPTSNLDTARTATIHVVVVDDGGTENGGEDTTTKTFTIAVNPVNDAPVLEPIGNRLATEDVTYNVGLSVNDAESDGSDLEYGFSVSNLELFNRTESGFVTANGSDTVTLNLVPSPNANGTASVTVTVTDSVSVPVRVVTQSFIITVNAVNDAPEFVLSTSNIQAYEDGNRTTVDSFIVGVGAVESQQSVPTVTVMIQLDDYKLFTVIPALNWVTGQDLSLVYQPTDNLDVVGVATIDVVVVDDGGTVNGGLDTTTQTVTIRVNPVNDAPKLGELDDVEVNEDAATMNVSLTVTDVDDGFSTLRYTVSSTNATLFSELKVVTDNERATLNIAYAPDANGVAEVTVVVTDPSGLSATQSFTITVNAVNDAPELLGDRDAIVYEDGQGLVKLVPDNFGIVEVDSSIVSASIQIGNWVEGDTVTWNASLGGGITIATRNEGAALVIDLSGGSSTTNYRAAIASIKYETTKAINSVTHNVLVVEVSDGALVSDRMELELELIPGNSEPVLSGDVSGIVYTEQGAGVAIAADNFSIKDDGDITIAVIEIETPKEGDELVLSTSVPSGVSIVNDGTPITIVGTANAETYAGMIKEIRYENGLDTVEGGVRVVTIRVKDALEYSAALTRNVVVTAVNDEPVLSGDGGVIKYRLGDEGIAVVPDDFSIEDVDDTMIASASIVLSPEVEGDRVTVDASGASELGIGVTELDSKWVLTGTKQLSDYISVLKTTRYSSIGEANSTRDVVIRVSDEQGGQSNALTRDIVVMPASVEPGPSPINGDYVVSANSEIRIAVSGNVDAGTVTHNVLVVKGNLTIESPAQLVLDLSQLEGTLAVGATLDVIRVRGTVTGNFSGGRVVGKELGFKIQVVLRTLQLVVVANEAGTVDVKADGVGLKATVLDDDGIQGEVRYTWVVADDGSDNWVESRTARVTATSPTTSVDTFVPSNETEGKQLEVRVEYTDAAGYVELVTKSYGLVLIVNDAPEFELADTSLVSNEDGVGQRYASFLTGIDAVDAGQLIQRVSLDVTTGQALFAVLPELVWTAGDTVATLNYTPTTNLAATGIATINVVVQDDGGVENGGEATTTKTFTIAVNAVNDAPTFGISTTDIQVNEGGDRVTENNFIVGVDAVDAADAIHTVTLSMQVGDHQLFTIRPTLNWVSRRDLSLIYQPTSNLDTARTATIHVVVVDDGGTENGGEDTTTKTFTITVNPVNDAPVLEPIGNRLATEDVTYNVGLSVNDAESDGSDLEYGFSVSNLELFNRTESGFVTANGSDTVTLNLVPSPNANGTASVTVTVTDSVSVPVRVVTQSFIITVNAVNDAPEFVLSTSNIQAYEDGNRTTVDSFIVGVGAVESQQSVPTVTVMIQLDDYKLFTVIPALNWVTGQDLSLVYQPTDNLDVVGVATIDVVVVDDGGTVNGGLDTTTQTVTIRVNPVNDAPKLGELDDVEVNEDAATMNVSLTVTDVDDGFSTLRYTVSSTNATLFSELKVVTDNERATLNIAYAPDANGVAEVTVVVTDPSGLSATQSFTITVNAVNDAPELLGDRDAIVYEDGQGLVKLVPDNFGIVEVDSSIVSASIQIGNWVEGDTVTWNASLGGGITIATRNEGAALVIDLSGGSSTTNYRAAIASIKYETTKAINSVTHNVLVVEVSDGALVSDRMELELELIPGNSEPVLSGDVSGIVYTEQGAGVAIAADNFSIKDDGDITIAVIEIETPKEGDELVLSTSVPSGVSIVNDGTPITIVGTANAETYAGMIKEIRYENGLDTVEGGVRVVTIRVKDALEYSAALTRNVVVTAVNDEPVLSGDGGVIKYRLGDEGIAVVPDDFSIEDVDDTMIASASIVLSPEVEGDRVTVDASGASELGIGVTELDSKWVLTGTKQLSDYISVLKTTRYSSIGEANSTRDVVIRVSDEQGGQSNALTRDIVVMPASVEPGPSPINGDYVVSANSEIRIAVSGNVDAGTVTHNVLVVKGNLTIESPAQLVLDLSQLEGTLAVGATLDVIRVRGTVTGNFSGGRVVGKELGFKIQVVLRTLQLVVVANEAGTVDVKADGVGLKATVLDDDGIQGEVRYTWVVADDGSDNWVESRTARVTATSPTTSVDTFVPSNETEGKQLEVRVEYTDAAGYVELVTKSYGLVLIVNDAPEFELADTSLVSNEDGVGQRYASFLTGIDAVDAGQLIQRVSLDVTTGQALFAVLPELVWTAGDTVATLNYTPTTNLAATGIATINVVVQDDGGVENGGEATTTKTFTITVNAVNDAPTFGISTTDIQVNEGGDRVTENNFIVGVDAVDAADAIHTVTLSMQVGDHQLFTIRPTLNWVSRRDLSLIYQPTSNLDTARTATIHVVVVDDGGTENGGEDTTTKTFTITVNPVNDAPVLEPIGNRLATEDVTYNVGLSVNDAESDGSDLEYGFSVSNLELFNRTESGFVTANGSDTVTLNLVPSPNANGTASVTVTVTDSVSVPVRVVTQSFIITVNAVNDAPEFVLSTSNIQAYEDGNRTTVDSFIVGVGAVESQQSVPTVTVMIQLDDYKLFTVIPALNWVTGQDLSLVYQPTDNLDVVGVATIDVVVVDDGGTVNGGLDTTTQTVTIRVNPVNDAPKLGELDDVEVNEDAATMNVSLTVTDVDDGFSTLRYTVSSTNATLFSELKVVTDNERATLNIAYAPDANGVAEVTVVVTDPSGLSATQSFTITVNVVNDAPTVSMSTTNLTVNEGGGSQTVGNFLTGIDAVEGSQWITRVSVNVKTGINLFAVSPALEWVSGSAVATLNYTPTTNLDATRVATIDVIVDDNLGGTTKETFTITVYLDSDLDGIPNTVESVYCAAPSANTCLDPNGDRDGDGISNGDEIRLGTDLNNADSDGDGVSDGAEVAVGSDPNNGTQKPYYRYHWLDSSNNRSIALDNVRSDLTYTVTNLDNTSPFLVVPAMNNNLTYTLNPSANSGKVIGHIFGKDNSNNIIQRIPFVIKVKSKPLSVTEDMQGRNPLQYVTQNLTDWIDTSSKNVFYDEYDSNKLISLANRLTNSVTVNVGSDNNYDPTNESISGTGIAQFINNQIASAWFIVKRDTEGKFEVSSNNTLTIRPTDSIQEVIALSTPGNEPVNEDQQKAISFYLSNKWGIASSTDSDEDGKADSEDKRLYDTVVVGNDEGEKGPNSFEPNDLGPASSWVENNGTLELIDGCAQATQSNPIVVSGKMVLSVTGDFIISSDCLE